jgi:hypothetical protein
VQATISAASEGAAARRAGFPDPNNSNRVLSPRRYLANLMYAERVLRREMLQAVIPGLAIEDANLLCADGGPWQAILVELGWRRPDAETIDAEDGTDDAGEAPAGATTGPADSPASSPRTRARTRSR